MTCGCSDPAVFGHAVCFVTGGWSLMAPERTVHHHCTCQGCPCQCHRARLETR